MLDVERIPVTFQNRDGLNLVGILEQPLTTVRQDLGVIFLSPGVKMRVAPHRLYNKMACCFLRVGMPVLRFDFWGLGDSEGLAAEDRLVQFYREVQLGRYISDTESAIDWMKQRTGVERVILAGLCGGAITGLLTGQGRTEVAALVALGIPVVLDGAQRRPLENITRGQLNDLGQVYVKKLVDISSWIRLLTLRTDFRLMFRSLKTYLSRRLGGQHTSSASEQNSTNLNPRFVPAFFNFLAGNRRLLLIFSGADRLKWEFEEKFAAFNRSRLEEHSELLEFVTIPHANHILSDAASQDKMFRLLNDWLLSHWSPAK